MGLIRIALEEEMPYCPDCGTKINKTAKFCRECGFNLTVEDTEQVQPNESTLIQKYSEDSSEASNESWEDNYEQRDIDWLQNFRKQYKEVIQLSGEMQSIAKEIPLLLVESANKTAGEVVEQLQELQRSFATIEKSLRSGTKPKSSDLHKMSRYLESACVYFGVACVTYRKSAEKPGRSIEEYINEKLSKASNAMDRVNEQFALLSKKSIDLESDNHDIAPITQGSHDKQRFNWFQRHLDLTMGLSYLLPFVVPLLVWLLWPSSFGDVDVLSDAIYYTILSALICAGIILLLALWVIHRKKRSLWWTLLLLLFPLYLFLNAHHVAETQHASVIETILFFLLWALWLTPFLLENHGPDRIDPICEGCGKPYYYKGQTVFCDECGKPYYWCKCGQARTCPRPHSKKPEI